MKPKTLDIILITLMVLFIVACTSQYKDKSRQRKGNRSQIMKQHFSSVVGLWKSEADENWRLQFFSNGTCIETYIGSSSDTSNYSISNSTLQCDVSVIVNQYTEYIKLSFSADPSKNTCYLLNGTTDSTLSLSPIQSYKILMFKKLP